MTPGLSHLVADPTSTTVWSERAQRATYWTPRQMAFLTWLRGDGWRRTTNRAMAEMFHVSPGTIAQWLRVMTSLGVVVRWSTRGRNGWTRLRRAGTALVIRHGSMHAPRENPQENDVETVESTSSLGACVSAGPSLFSTMRHLMPFLDRP